jgi:flagellar hook-associated protein 3 FlgL
VSGVHLFGGTNQSDVPLPDYEGNSGAAQVTSSFSNTFGFPLGDPATATLTSAQLSSWLDGDFAAQFAPASWEASFSNAESTPMSVRVGKQHRIELPTTANHAAIRQVYAALVSVAELSSGALNAEAFKTVVDHAAAELSSAVQGLGDMQAELGVSQKALTDAKENLKMRKNWLTQAIQTSEQVDPYEAATRVNGLMNQLEASYSVTGRISRLSLLNYL